MLKINEEKLNNFKSELEDENSLLPLMLLIYIDNFKYINNLKKNNIFYDNVQDEIFNRRMVIQYLTDEELIRFGEDELIDWLKDNPKYSDVVIDG